MNSEQYSLSNLRDIVIPDPVPWWPIATGAWVLLAVVVCLGAIFTLHARRNWRRNAYRRAGLALLEDAETAYEISVILKRVALAAFPREQVASLYGEEWSAFLHRTCPQCEFSMLRRDQPASEDLMKQSRTWITRHSLARPKPQQRGEGPTLAT